MEIAADRGRSNRENFYHFQNCLQHNWIFEFSKWFLSEKNLAKSCLSELEKIASLKGHTVNSRILQSSGRILDSHFCSNLAFYDRNSSESLERLAVLSGSGDAKNISSAFNISVFETLERVCYIKAKESSESAKAFKLRSRSETNKISFKPLSGTGTAIHRTPARAILGGILEVVERDAYLCHWYTGKPPKKLHNTLTKDSTSAQKRAQALGLELNIFKLSTDVPGVHVVLATTQDTTNRFENSGFCSGVAASFCLKKAISKALFELDRFVDLYLRLGKRANTIDLPPSHPMSRFYLYLKPENREKLTIFLEGEIQEIDKSEFASKEVSLLKFITSLEKLDHEVFVFPLEVPSRLKNHIFCSHVTIPSLQQLDYEDNPILNNFRLRSFHSEAQFPRPFLHPLP